MQALVPNSGVAGYRAAFTYCVNGKPLRGAAYQPVTVLYRRDVARYVQDGHTQRVQVRGEILSLDERIYHDDRKPLTHWLAAQARYMRLEADKLHSVRFGALGRADQLRRLVIFAPVAMFFYCLFVRGCVLDGRPGLFYAFQRAVAEAILSLYLIERNMHQRP